MIISIAAGASTLVHECYSEAAMKAQTLQIPPERRERFIHALTTTHTEVRQAAMRAREAGVEKLVFTHLLPTADEAELLAEARSLFAGEVYVARDGLVLDV